MRALQWNYQLRWDNRLIVMEGYVEERIREGTGWRERIGRKWGRRQKTGMGGGGVRVGRWQQETREIRWLRRAEGEVEMGGGWGGEWTWVNEEEGCLRGGGEGEGKEVELWDGGMAGQ